MSEYMTCQACKRRVTATWHCRSRTCDWTICPVCGATNSKRGWNQPHEFARSLAAATAWARRHKVDVRFVEVGKRG